MITTDKLKTFAWQLERGFTNEFEKNADFDAELHQSVPEQVWSCKKSYSLIKIPTLKKCQHKESQLPEPHHQEYHTPPSTIIALGLEESVALIHINHTI